MKTTWCDWEAIKKGEASRLANSTQISGSPIFFKDYDFQQKCEVRQISQSMGRTCDREFKRFNHRKGIPPQIVH